jgi:hypothetical protein
MHRSVSSIAVLAGTALVLAGCGGDSEQAKKQAKRELAEARSVIATQKREAIERVVAAQQDVKDAEQRLADENEKIKRAAARLERLRAKISGAQETIARNTIPGDGTFEVGKDIESGVYRAEAREGCYWARLSSLDTSDIIDNENADGPAVLEVKPTDRALEVHRCADFHKAD